MSIPLHLEQLVLANKLGPALKFQSRDLTQSANVISLRKTDTLTYILGLHKFLSCVDVSVLFENQQLLGEVQCDVLRHAVPGHEKLLKFSGTGRFIVSRNFVV